MVVYSGLISLSGLTAGANYFLSDATPGLLTTTETSTIGYVSKPLMTAKTTTEGVVNVTRGMVIATPYYPRYVMDAAAFDNPNSADWAVNALAPAGADPSNAGLIVRAFDDTAEEGVGNFIEIPSGALNLHLEVKYRAASSPGSLKGIVPKLYFRRIQDGSATGAWNAGITMSRFEMSDATWTYGTLSDSLSTLGMVAGNLYQIEYTRNGADGSDDLAGDFLVLYLTIRFS
jgi:hypothetical protein